jgi:hypothetical protein
MTAVRRRSRQADLGLILAFTALLAGCAHTSPFTEEPYFAAVGKEQEFILTVDTRKAGDLSQPLLMLVPGAQDNQDLYDRLSRITVATSLPVMQEDGTYSDTEPELYGAVEGNLSMPLLRSYLSAAPGWRKEFSEGHTVWSNDGYGLEVAVPENGIALFSTLSIEQPLTGTYSERELFIPLEAAEKMAEGIAGMYVQSPRYLFSLFEDIIPYSLLVSIDSIWLSIDEAQEGYTLYGMVKTTQKAATTVISLTLKKKYLERIRTLETRPENWMESIVVDDEQNILIQHVAVGQDELTQLLANLTHTMIQE